MLSLLGIEDWRIEKQKWNLLKKRKIDVFHIEGSYFDSDGLKNYFIEKHIFYKYKIVQLLYIRPYKANTSNKFFDSFVDKKIQEI